mmetsp:Transcript_23564/g.59597  ORF Transcript_23564/g.59597 Transcript_23564/m.59597 type:complete len:209 (-) Transcript_23564:375-1001(-)
MFPPRYPRHVAASSSKILPPRCSRASFQKHHCRPACFPRFPPRLRSTSSHLRLPAARSSANPAAPSSARPRTAPAPPAAARTLPSSRRWRAVEVLSCSSGSTAEPSPGARSAATSAAPGASPSKSSPPPSPAPNSRTPTHASPPAAASGLSARTTARSTFGAKGFAWFSVNAPHARWRKFCADAPCASCGRCGSCAACGFSTRRRRFC